MAIGPNTNMNPKHECILLKHKISNNDIKRSDTKNNVALNELAKHISMIRHLRWSNTAIICNFDNPICKITAYLIDTGTRAYVFNYIEVSGFGNIIHISHELRRKNYVLMFQMLGMPTIHPMQNNDKVVVFEVCRRNPQEFQSASDRLKNDRKFVIELIKVKGEVLQYLKDPFQDDDEIVYEACRGDEKNLVYASGRIQNNWEQIQVTFSYKKMTVPK